jgi:hypothetical protein
MAPAHAGSGAATTRVATQSASRRVPRPPPADPRQSG